MIHLHSRLLSLSCMLLYFSTVAEGQSMWLKEDFSEFATGDLVKELDCGDNCTVRIKTSPGLPMIFDSVHPTRSDLDLGTPNQLYNGPGVGAGGQANNKKSRGQVLIISKDNNTATPNDVESGGKFWFFFDQPMIINSIGILDNDKGFRIRVWGDNDQLLYSKKFPLIGENSFQFASIKVAGAMRMLVQPYGSGAITEIYYTPVPTIQLEAIQLPKDPDFGKSLGGPNVSIDGETAVVGSYVYSKTDKQQWELQARLGGNQTCRCFSVRNAISGNTVVVGNRLFVRQADGQWIHQWNLPRSTKDQQVALDGDTLVVGKSVYVRKGEKWTYQATLQAKDVELLPYQDQVKISGSTIVYAGSNTTEVFVRNGSTWSWNVSLSANDSDTKEILNFGRNFDIDGDTIVVAAVQLNHTIFEKIPCVYVYEREGVGWSQRYKVLGDGKVDPFSSISVDVTIDKDTIALAVYVTVYFPMHGGATSTTMNIFHRYFGSYWQRLQQDTAFLYDGPSADLDISDDNCVLGSMYSGHSAYIVEL